MRYSDEDKAMLEEISLEILREFIRICDKHKLTYFAAFGTAIGAVRHKGFIPWDDDMDVIMLRDDYDRFVEIAKQEMSDEFELFSAPIQKRIQGFYLQMSKKGTVFMTNWNTRWPIHPGIKLDIFPYDCVPENGKERLALYNKLRFWNRLYIIRNVKCPYFEKNTWKEKLVKAICAGAYYVMKVTGPSVETIIHKYTTLMTSYKNKTGYMTVLDDMTPDNWVIRKDEILPLQEAEFEGLTIKLPYRNHEILTRMYGDYMQLPPEEKRDGHNLAEVRFTDSDQA